MEEYSNPKGRRTYHAVKILLIRDFLLTHTNKEHYATSKEIIEYLEGFGIHADRKTIFADIDRLQYDYGMKIDRVQKKGYCALEPAFEPSELRMLIDSVQSAKFITEKEAAAITNKIKKLADVYTKHSLDRKSFVNERIRNKSESVVKHADKIHEAIAANNQISFKYFHYSAGFDKAKQYSNKGELITVSPFALYWNEGNYYMYAYLSDKDEFRYYRIDRMEGISLPLQMKREGGDKYQKDTFTKRRDYKQFSMFKGDQEDVKLRFQNRFADAVIDEFGKDVILAPIDDNHFTVIVPVELSPPFYAWLTTFGKSVKILNPPKAIDGMKEFISKVAAMYEADVE